MEQEKKLLPIKRIEAVWIKVPKNDVSDIKLERFKFKKKLILVPYRFEKNWLLSEDGKLTLDIKKYYKCHYCEQCNFTETEITKDHKNPQSKGGTDNIHNIVPACLKCNRDKADTPYAEYIRILKARKKIQLNKLKITVKSNENENNSNKINEHNNTHRSNSNKLQRKRPNRNTKK
jgi:endonuclease I